MARPIVPVACDPQSDEAISASIDVVGSYATRTEADARPLVEFVDVLKSMDWKRRLDGEPKTWERFCSVVLGFSSGFFDEIKQGIAILEAAGRKGPISQKEAIAAYAQRAAHDAKEAERRMKAGKRLDPNDIVMRVEQGNSAGYLTRRIARHHPEILERMRAGEFTSVRQAALEAGIVKPTFTCPLDPGRAARLIAKHFSGEQLTQLIELLVAMEVEA